MSNWLERTELIMGEAALQKLRASNILVVGLGGVGAFAAEMLGRAGVGRMTIVDGDTIAVSNRNRQLPALRSTQGMAKAVVMGQRLMDINPDMDLTVILEFLKDKRMEEVLDVGFDYVVDAIDTLSPKIFLIYHSIKRNLPVVSSMGAGGKFDPAMIRISDISETNNCPLARMLRKRLHHLGIREGFSAVYSPEVVDKKRIRPVSGERNKASVVGTISYMPAAFGIACASVVIRKIAGI